MSEEDNVANKIGSVLGEILGVIITLGFTGGILFFCWNYGLYEVAPVEQIKYYQSFLIILGWRCLTYKQSG